MRPYLRAANVTWNGLDLSDVMSMNFSPSEAKEYELRPGDILLSEASGSPNEVGKPAVWRGEIDGCCFQNTLIRVRPSGALGSYLYWHFYKDALTGDFGRAARGVGIHHLGSQGMSDWTVSLAPRDEQKRIVAEIEKQFTRIEAAVKALEAARQRTHLGRAAVLKAAAEGRLVSTEASLANTHGRPFEPATSLLQCYLADRKARWQGSRRHAEPIAPPTNLPAPPAGWAWVTLDQLTRSVKDGPHYSPKYVDRGGVPFITGGNVRPDGVDFENAKRISSDLHKELCRKCKPEKGDILYTKGGTTGIARVNTYDIEFSVWVHVAVLKLVDDLDPFFVQHALNSPGPHAQSQRFTHGVGNQDLGLTRMVRIFFGLPPVAEQRRIVDEVDRRLSLLNTLEREIETAASRTTVLRSAILHRAFEGRLFSTEHQLETAIT
jgi:type I restriction enzyme, S subunit